MAATTSDSDGESKKMITLISSEGESFETTEAAAAMSTTIANMIEDGCVDETGVRLPNVTSRILAKVLEYCNKHAAADENTNSGDSDSEDAAENTNSGDSEEAAENTNSGDSEEAAENTNSGDSEDAAENTNSGDSEDAASASRDLESFDAEFIDEDDMETLYNLLLAANFLDIKGLLDLCIQTTADMIKGKTPEEIREKFGIANDFTKEEEEAIRNENAWAFH